jgi:hypothetical protein
VNHFKEMNNFLKINKTLNNNNLINEWIHQNYDHLKEVITSGNERNYDSNESQFISKHMLIKDN